MNQKKAREHPGFFAHAPVVTGNARHICRYVEADPVKAIVLVLNSLHRIVFRLTPPEPNYSKTNDQKPMRNNTVAEITVPAKAIP